MIKRRLTFCNWWALQLNNVVSQICKIHTNKVVDVGEMSPVK